MQKGVTLAPRVVKLTTRFDTTVQRTLPHQQLRMIGAWCFIDHFGPSEHPQAMSVAAHPHTGLQTASWLFSGAIEHRDSLGSIQVINPGELNLMTAGHGIAHSELAQNASSHMHGVQLWIALPESQRNRQSSFHHYAQLPSQTSNGVTTTVFVGELEGMQSPAIVYSELLGAQVEFEKEAQSQIDCRVDFEYGILVTSGDVSVNGVLVPCGSLHYLPAGTSQIKLYTEKESTAILLGGIPFEEKIVMWWNFIGRSHEDIKQMRMDWLDVTARFPRFADQIGGEIPAPQMPNVTLRAR